MYDNQYGNGAQAGRGPGRGATEALIAVIVAAIVASVVVLVGGSSDAGRGSGAGGTPTSTFSPGTPSPTATTASPTATETSPSADPSETDEPAEVTSIDVSVEPTSYTGECPTTVTFRARIKTNTGPVKAHYQWLDVDDGAGPEQTVQFGGPGPQGVTVTEEVEVNGDDTIFRRLRVTKPNELRSDGVDVTVTCTPTARTWLDFDETCSNPYTIVYHGSITAPHGPMTVTYTWERSDGATGPIKSISFPAGGKQTLNVPDNTWSLSTSGEFSQRIKILTPFEYTSNWSTFKLC